MAKTGREQRRHTRTAQARTPRLDHFYRYRQPPITPGDFTFLLDLLRPRHPPLSLDRMVDTLSWDDEQSALTGSVTAYRPVPSDPATLPVARGHLLRCRVRWAGGIYRLWTMRCQAPQVEVDTGQVTITLQDDMALLDGGTRDWWFRKTKARPQGYTCDEIAGVVARTLGVRLRQAARGTTRFELKMRGATGLAVLKAAYAKEKAKSGRAFVVRLRNGQLEIVPLARNPMLYVLGPQIQTALITQRSGAKVPTTVLTGRARLGHGRATQSIAYTEYDRRMVRLLGYVHDTKDFGRVSSHGELRRLVQRELATRLRLNDTLSITHQGIPFILRGDGVDVHLPWEGYTGAGSFVYCIRAVHTVQAATYTTQWDFNAADPYVGGDPASKSTSRNAHVRAAKARKRRAIKRAQRSRPKLHA